MELPEGFLATSLSSAATRETTCAPWIEFDFITPL
jgi:hypothetical protein